MLHINDRAWVLLKTSWRSMGNTWDYLHENLELEKQGLYLAFSDLS